MKFDLLNSHESYFVHNNTYGHGIKLSINWHSNQILPLTHITLIYH
jgi:hypothetical protein